MDKKRKTMPSNDKIYQKFHFSFFLTTMDLAKTAGITVLLADKLLLAWSSQPALLGFFHQRNDRLTFSTMLKSNTCSGNTGCLGLMRTEASAIISRWISKLTAPLSRSAGAATS